MRHSFELATILQLATIALTVLGGGLAIAAGDTVAAGSRYLIKGDTVYDQKLALTWRRCSIGQLWVEGAGCVGAIKVVPFDDAQREGDETWRVPTKEELASLIDENKGAKGQQPTIDEAVFPGMGLDRLWYWTSTAADDSLACYVDFFNGFSYYGGSRSAAYAVRLVRDGR
jgi:hypothetical protein